MTYFVPVSASETIVQCKNYHLFRRELYSLRPETWLDDNVISTISDDMTSVQRKMEDSVNWYLPIVFAVGSKIIFVQLTSYSVQFYKSTTWKNTISLYWCVVQVNADDPSKCISFAKKHKIKENYMSDLLCCEKVKFGFL